jgi:Asp/Glu/hydantoin racemase
LVVNGTGRKESSKIRILLCNPNATKFMTENCVNMVQPTLPPDVEVVGFTSPKPAPTAIEGNFDSVMSAAAAVRAIIPIADQYDAFLVACYSDHALIRILREEVDKPVIGIMEASLFAARTLGNRFGLIATSKRSVPMAQDAIRHYGFDGFCVGVGCCRLGVLELESKPEKEVLEIMCGVAKDLVAKGADSLTLGCAGMTKLKPAVEEAVGKNVQVIDGVLAGVHHLVGLVRMGGRTAKAGMYASGAAGRKARGQDYY